jgi:hydroxypyruvate reductase
MSDGSSDLQPSASESTLFEMRNCVRDVFSHVLTECSIPKAFSRALQADRGYLRVGPDTYDLASFSRLVVISMGKAGHTMAEALASIAGPGLSGIVACPTLPSAQLFGFRYFKGGHPLPNQESLRAGDAIFKLLAAPAASTLVIYLISGGASAIAEKSIIEKLSLAEVDETYRALVHSGAPIAEINAIRKHLSALKGGRLAKAAAPAFQVSVLVSDVPDNCLDALASGPTMPDSTTVADCHAIARRYGLVEQFPASVRSLFERDQLRETPKVGDPAFERSRYTIVLSNTTAQKAAVERAALSGFAIEVDNSCDDWDYEKAADHLLVRLRELRKGVSRACLISGGEVTVKVQGKPGIGGRNQQFALYCAQKIAGENITVLSAGTDGIDGSSDAAGALVDGTTVRRARQKGLDVASALQGFDASPMFDALGDSIVTGPTGNNVRDLRILLAY